MFQPQLIDNLHCVMRSIKYLLVLIIFASIITGCNKDDSYKDNDLSLLSDMLMYSYSISISFENETGIDLVAPLGEDRWISSRGNHCWVGEINPEKYELNVVYSDFPDFSSSEIYRNYRYSVDSLEMVDDNNVAYFMMAKYDDNYDCTSEFKEEYAEGDGKFYLNTVLTTPIRAWNIDVPRQDNIIYNITCPTVFGDNTTHQLVAYWSDDSLFPLNSNETSCPECIRATFDGKEVIVKKAVIWSGPHRDFYSYFIDIVLDK